MDLNGRETWAFLLFIALIFYALGTLSGLVLGESREQCVAVNSTKAILVIEDHGGIGELGDCNWVASEVIQKGEYKLDTYTDDLYMAQNLWLFLK